MNLKKGKNMKNLRNMFLMGMIATGFAASLQALTPDQVKLLNEKHEGDGTLLAKIQEHLKAVEKLKRDILAIINIHLSEIERQAGDLEDEVKGEDFDAAHKSLLKLKSEVDDFLTKDKEKELDESFKSTNYRFFADHGFKWNNSSN